MILFFNVLVNGFEIFDHYSFGLRRQKTNFRFCVDQITIFILKKREYRGIIIPTYGTYRLGFNDRSARSFGAIIRDFSVNEGAAL